MSNSIKLYNTLTRKIEVLEPKTPGEVKIYCCGPTVYGFQHIGNFKTFLFEDLLVRTLRYSGLKVTHVMNITDVGHLVGDGDDGEDKMLVAMRKEGKTSLEIADFYTAKFLEDWDKLNLNRPNIICKATEHIADTIELIKKIEANGYAYFSNGNVYFDVGKLKDYGKLAKLDLNKLQAGTTVAVDPNKRNPFDFVLWFTKSKFENQELQWDSPWGRGYPGWHIECSAMSMKYLGEEFDIHCGGIDHIPVHHTNEIAQSEAATGKKWVNVWMHSEFMLINSEKMSKSTGKLLLLDDLINQGFSPECYRFVCLSANYRMQLNFSLETMKNAKQNIDKLKTTIINLKDQNPALDLNNIDKNLVEEFKDAIFNDLNSPLALSVMWKVVNSNELSNSVKLATLYSFDQVLGFGFDKWQKEELEIPEEAEKLLAQRIKARNEKNWAAADNARDELLKLGFKVEDSKDGAKLVKI
jgi:cysteinyl-tRNA synthetase